MKHILSSRSKLRVGVIFGGKSAEHEISVLSAKSVVAALDTNLFEPVLIGINTHGGWCRFDSLQELSHITIVDNKATFDDFVSALAGIDVVFPVLHGPYGEDGTMQGLLELAGMPYVGCGVLGSAVGMDKDIMKRLLRDAGVPITDFLTLTAGTRHQFDSIAVVKEFGLPLFVKPANMGSSVGVSKAMNSEELMRAIDQAFRYDRKVLIEKAVVGDEVECAVLGNDDPQVSVAGRIIPKADFYSYEAKYHDDQGTVLEIPAKINETTARKAQDLALKAFKALGCEGMARVDMFTTADGEVLVNEINTIPGFTQFSMYPRLWEATGIPYATLLTQLVNLALERFENKNHLKTSHNDIKT